MKPVLKNAGLALGFLVLCALVAFTIGCPIKAVTGFPCPGCGLTRGCLALLRLDFAGAFHWHPLSFLVPAAFLIYIFRDSWKPLGFFTKAPVLVTAAVLMLAVYIWRMKTLFPYVAPMNFQMKSLFGKFVHLLLQ